jgi:predicted ATPase
MNEAAEVVEDGIRLARLTASQFHEPELLCLKAELLSQLSASDLDEAEACLREALRLTRETGAKSLELRAIVSFCRLLRERVHTDEWQALTTLAGSFTEGFDTEDLIEARAMLDPSNNSSIGRENLAL